MLGDNGNKCTTWVLGNVMCMWGQGVYGKSLYMPLNFAVNLNCSKNKGLKKKKKEVMNSVSNNIVRTKKPKHTINKPGLVNVYRILPTSGECIFFSNRQL